MRGRSFLIATVSTLLLCGLAYFLAVDRLAIARRFVDKTYKEFLLKGTESLQGRIIVDSGSNSRFGIVAELMENHFRRPAINLADYAGVPFRHMIYNIGSHLSRGDIIILPLEWKYYSEGGKFSKKYVEFVLDKQGRYSFYYAGLPLLEKVRLIFTGMPLSMTIARIFALNGVRRHNKPLVEDEIRTIREFNNSIDQSSRGSHLVDDGRLGPGDEGTSINTCDQYIFSREPEKGLTISGEFRKNLSLLEAVARKKGARVFFTWPAVVGKTGNECYTSAFIRENLDSYIYKIKDEVKKHGFEFIGSPYESRFDSSCFRDTYYHIRYDCAIERTRRLIRDLDAIGLDKKNKYSPEATNAVLREYLANVPSSFFTARAPIRLNTPLGKKALSEQLYLLKGWSWQEEWGLWSTGKESEIIFSRPREGFDAIRLRGVYFWGPEKTTVRINGRLMGSFVLIDAVIPVDKDIYNAKIIKITLEHKNPISPYDVGISEFDKRKIKYGLTGFELLSKRRGEAESPKR